MSLQVPLIGVHAVGRVTQTAATVIVAGIPPFGAGPDGKLRPFAVDSSGLQTWESNSAFTHILTSTYLTGANSHIIGFVRPANWTYVTAAVAKNATTMVLAADPGLYSTNFKYPQPTGFTTGTAVVADAATASGDWLMTQLTDGTWFLSAVSSLSTLTVTLSTAIPNVTGGGVAVNTPVFLFRAVTLKDPNTGQLPVLWDTVASVIDKQPAVGPGPLVSGLHRGDPLLFYSNNVTAAGFLGVVSVGYSREVGRGA